MKKLLMGLMVALMPITSAHAFSWDQFWIDQDHPDLDQINWHNDIQWTWTDQVDGLTIRISGVKDSTIVGLNCWQTETEMNALTLEQHAAFLNSVEAAHWWHDEEDSMDSHDYWRDTAWNNADFTLSGLTGVLGIINNSDAKGMMSRACYSKRMSESDRTNIHSYVSFPRHDATYNQKVRALIAAGS